MAFDAIMDRYSRNDVAVVMYHLHIPRPDPMTNPSTKARAQFCGAFGTPSYAIDGKMDSGGGDRDEAKSYYDKLNSKVEERLEAPAEARIRLDAYFKDGMVRAEVTVDEITDESSELRLQVALVEEELSYSGQNNTRFHPMVVRSLGGEGHRGFPVERSGKSTVEHLFDLEKVTRELKADLEDFEKEREMTFTQKKHEIDKGKLSVVAFVQDAESKQVLQSVFVKVEAVN